MTEHVWSGWPGAYCINCFEHDPVEECLATHDLGNSTSYCVEHRMTDNY